jgi:hypothetical protein
MMADASVAAAIGAEAVWRLLPGVLRPWWINPVKAAFATFDVAEVSLDSPCPVLVDMTEARDEYLDMRKALKFANIIDVVDRRLKATVLCPFGDAVNSCMNVGPYPWTVCSSPLFLTSSFQ